MTTIESTTTTGVSGVVEPLNLKISTDTTSHSCGAPSSDSASSPTSSTKSCGENIVPTASTGTSQQDQAASTTTNLTLVNNTASPIPSDINTITTTAAPLANKNNLLNNEANVKSNMPTQAIIMNSNLIKPNNAQIVNNGSPTKVPIPRIKKPATLKPAQPVSANSMGHPKPILPAPHNPSPVKTVHIPIAAKPPAISNNSNKTVTAQSASLLNLLPSQAKTSPKSTAANGKSDDSKNMQSLPSINTLTNGATFNLNQNQFYQFVPVSSQHLAALAAANGGNGAGNPLIIATTSMPKPYLTQNRTNNEANANGTESSTPGTGQLIMKTIMPNTGLDPILQQQYLNLLQQKQQVKLSPNGIKTASSSSSDTTASTGNSGATNKPALAVLPKPTNTAPAQQNPTPSDDYLALQQRLLAEERRNNLLENKLREQEMLQQKQMQHIQPNTTTTPNVPKAKLKPIAVKPASNDSKIETTPGANKSELASESGGNLAGDESINSTATPVPSKTPSNPSGKKRGRPRLYDVDPQTGKSIKPKSTTNVSGPVPQPNIQPNMNPQLVKIAINPSNVLLMGAMTGIVPQNPLVNSAPTASPGMFPSPSTSNTNSSDIPTENTAPPAPQVQSSSTDISKSDSEKENNIDECKRAESRSPNKRKKSSPVKVVEEEPAVVTPPIKPSTPGKSAIGIPKQITPADLSPSAPLTHFLDGYVVKEAGKPFPLTKNQNDSSNKKHKSDEHIKCDQCGAKFNKKSGISSGDDKSVLFCSESCFKRYHKKSKHRSDSSEMSKRFKHDQDMNDVTRTPPRQKLNSSMSIDSPSSKRSPHCKHHGSSSKHKHHSSSHKKDHHRSRGGHHNSHNTSMTNGNNNDETAMDSSFVQPAPVLASSNLSQAPIRTSSPNTSLVDSTYPNGDPTNWSCDQVYQFVCQVTGNEQVARLFKTEEVDGSALSLIRDDHLVQTMQVKLGPALKIMSKFNELKAKYGH